MRRRRVVAAVVVAICVLVPLVEAFDTWDQTIQDGNDTEADVVVLALCVGMAYLVAGTKRVLSPTTVATLAPMPILPPGDAALMSRAARSAIRRTGSSPPLRI